MTHATVKAESSITISPVNDPDRLRALLAQRWGDTLLMFGRSWKFGDYDAYVAQDASGEALGLVTTTRQGATRLALTLDNFSTLPGIGGLLLDHVMAMGRTEGSRTLRAVTTNDNTPALRYFQKRGFRIVAFYPGAVAVYRAVATSLPMTGVDGIPVRDAIEMEIDL